MKGTSVVLLQSDKGTEIWKQISDKLCLKKVTLQEASIQNQAMLKASAINEKRSEAFQCIREGRIADTAEWVASEKAFPIKKKHFFAAKVLNKIITSKYFQFFKHKRYK